LASSGTLELGDAGGFAATIAGFSDTDVIDLLGASVTSLSYSPSTDTLTVSGSGGTIASLKFSGSYTTASFATVSDGHGGTDILDPPRKAAARTSIDESALTIAAKLHQFVHAVAVFGAEGSSSAPSLVAETALFRPILAVATSAHHGAS